MTDDQGHRPWQDRICLCVMDDRLDTLQLPNCFHWPGSEVYFGISNFLPLHKGYYLHLENVSLMRHGSVMRETEWRDDRGLRFRYRPWKVSEEMYIFYSGRLRNVITIVISYTLYCSHKSQKLNKSVHFHVYFLTEQQDLLFSCSLTPLNQ